MSTKKPEELIFHVKRKGRGNEEGIWMLGDDSCFVVLEVTPIPFYDLKKNQQKELIDKLDSNFIKKLTFPIETIIRPVNSNIGKKLTILDSLLSYNINKTDNSKLIEYYESFTKWFKEYVTRFATPHFVYYVVINYNTYYEKRNFEMQYKKSIEILKKRIDFVKTAFTSAKLRTKQLNTRQLGKIYDSFLRFHIQAKGHYLMPEDYLNLYKKGKIIDSKKVVENPGEEKGKIIENLKEEIHKKGVLPLSYITDQCKKLKKKERTRIQEALESDPGIVLEGDVFKLVTLQSSTEREFLTQMRILEKQELQPDKIKVGNTLYRGIIVVANPPKGIPDFLNKLYQGRDNITTAIHISPESTINVVHDLTYELNQIEKEINRLAFEGKISDKKMVELEDKRNFLKDKIEKITSEEIVPFKLSFTFVVEDINDEDLDFSTNKVLAYLRKRGFVVKIPVNYQKETLKTILPSGANFIKRRDIITTNKMLSSFFPFVKR